MPKTNSSLIQPDSLIMTPNDVNDSIVNYLERNGFSVFRGTSHTEVDIRAVKNDIELIIESRGNQAYRNFGTDIVFDGSQLDIQLSEHLTQTMRFQQFNSTRNTSIFIMGFPDINRVKGRVSKISKGLDKLQILRFWVNNFNKVRIDGPTHLKTNLGL